MQTSELVESLEPYVGNKGVSDMQAPQTCKVLKLFPPFVPYRGGIQVQRLQILEYFELTQLARCEPRVVKNQNTQVPKLLQALQTCIRNHRAGQVECVQLREAL
jgi:hypothetical protein